MEKKKHRTGEQNLEKRHVNIAKIGDRRKSRRAQFQSQYGYYRKPIVMLAICILVIAVHTW